MVSARFLPKSSFLYYTLLSCIGVTLIHLERFEEAKKFYYLSFSNLDNKAPVFSNSLTFISAPITLFNQTGDKDIEIIFKKFFK